jgi:uracil-DNA glycosylase
MFSLFNDEMTIPELKEWSFYINPRIEHSINLLLSYIEVSRKDKIIYPEQKDILAAFRDTTPDKVKVIILGQDPYHDDNATGHAFACKNKMSPSLVQIIGSLTTSSEDVNNFYTSHYSSLLHLIEQGVMLLNTILTVEKGQPLSHSGIGWEKVIAEFLKEFSTKEKGVVYMLWGNHAKEYHKYINHRGNLMLFAQHPVSASYKGGIWQCDHFKKANEFLIKNNKQPINWI